MHLQRNISPSRYPSVAFDAHLSYAVTRVFITIISTTSTASARSATALRIVNKAISDEDLQRKAEGDNKQGILHDVLQLFRRARDPFRMMVQDMDLRVNVN